MVGVGTAKGLGGAEVLQSLVNQAIRNRRVDGQYCLIHASSGEFAHHEVGVLNIDDDDFRAKLIDGELAKYGWDISVITSDGRRHQFSANDRITLYVFNVSKTSRAASAAAKQVQLPELHVFPASRQPRQAIATRRMAAAI